MSDKKNKVKATKREKTKGMPAGIPAEAPQNKRAWRHPWETAWRPGLSVKW